MFPSELGKSASSGESYWLEVDVRDAGEYSGEGDGIGVGEGFRDQSDSSSVEVSTKMSGEGGDEEVT